MARGYIYEISENKEELFRMDESDFYEKINFEADYFSNENLEERSFLEEKLNPLGIEFVHEKGTDHITFMISEQQKENYFQDRYEKLKKKVNEITLAEFAQGRFDDIQSLIEDTFDDAMYYNYELMTLDTFIRISNPNSKYYLGNVVLMH